MIQFQIISNNETACQTKKKYYQTSIIINHFSSSVLLCMRWLHFQTVNSRIGKPQFILNGFFFPSDHDGFGKVFFCNEIQ